MKPFRFSLQSIRSLREQREREAQLRFSNAMRACEEAAFQLQTASDELAAGWAALCQELSEGIASSKLLRTRSWCNVLENRQKECANALQAARRAMDAASRELTAATRDREALDRYHDKSRRAYDRLLRQEEQKFLDEIGLRRSAVIAPLSRRRAGRQIS